MSTPEQHRTRPDSRPVRENARVLVVVDQKLLAETIRMTLDHGVYVTRDAHDELEAARVAAAWHPHVIVVDMDLGGDRLLQRIGRPGPGSPPRTPVVALTRRGDLKTKLAAFDQGVDDILTIPFAPEELLARVLAVTRRSYGESPVFDPVIKLGELELDILNRQVSVGGHVLHLTGLEQSLLYMLAANAGRVVTRDEILDALWGTDFVSESNVVDRHVRALRAKLQNDHRRPRFIATVPGRGYRFIPTSSESEPTP